MMSKSTSLPLVRFCRYNAQRLRQETGGCSIKERALRIARLGSLRLPVDSASENGLGGDRARTKSTINRRLHRHLAASSICDILCHIEMRRFDDALKSLSNAVTLPKVPC